MKAPLVLHALLEDILDAELKSKVLALYKLTYTEGRQVGMMDAREKCGCNEEYDDD